MFVALLDLQRDLLVKVEDIAWFCYCFLKDPVEIESTTAWCKLHAIHLWICPPVQCSEDFSSNGSREQRGLQFRHATSSRYQYCYLDLVTICQLNQYNTNSEAAMLSTYGLF